MPVTFPFAGTRPLFAGLRVVARGRNVPTGIDSSVGTSFTIPDTTTAGSVLAVLSLAGTSNGTGTWSLSGGTWAARASLSATTGVTTVNVVLGNVTGLTAGSSGTITARYVGETVDLTLTLTVTMQSATTGTLLTPTLYNTSTSASTLAWRPIGLAFDPGEVPSGSIPKCRVAGGADVDMPFFDLRRYADGSLWSCQAYILDDTPIAAGTSNNRDYEIYSTGGTQAAGTIDTRAWIQAQTDTLTMDLTNNSVFDGASSTSLGNRSYNLKTAAATAARFEVRADTLRVGRFRCRQKLAGEEHQIGLWFGTQIRNAAGTAVRALSIAPKLDLPFVVDNPSGTTQTRGRRDFDIVTKWGAATLHSETGNQQACYTRYPVLRQTADLYNSAPLWIDVDGSSPMPTTRVVWTSADWAKFSRAGLAPPMDRSQPITLYTGPQTHVTGSRTDPGRSDKTNGFSQAVNGTGGSAGRGLEPDPMSRAIIRQGATDWLCARVAAVNGDLEYVHYRDHEQSGGVESYGLIPFPFYRQGGGVHTWTGLGSERVAVRGAGGTITIASPGGTGAFRALDSAHPPECSGFMGWFEARDDLCDAALSGFDYQCRWLNHNNIGGDYGVMWWDKRTGIPTWSAEHWGSLPHFFSQERSWGPNLFAMARAVLADSDRHVPYLDMMAKNYSDWINRSLEFFPASQIAYGTLWRHSNPSSFGGLMNSIVTLAHYRLARIYRGATYAGIAAAFEQLARMPINIAKYNPAGLDAYHHVLRANDWNADYPPPTEIYHRWNVSVSGNRIFITEVDKIPELVPAAGDVVKFTAYSRTLGPVATPTGLEGVKLYVLDYNSSDKSIAVSLTPGGSQLTMADLASGAVGAWLAKFSAYATTNALTAMNDDDFGPATDACIQATWANSHPDLSQADYVAWEAFYRKTTTTNAVWCLDGTLVRPLT